jgi:hypothetical protein
MKFKKKAAQININKFKLKHILNVLLNFFLTYENYQTKFFREVIRENYYLTQIALIDISSIFVH